MRSTLKAVALAAAMSTVAAGPAAAQEVEGVRSVLAQGQGANANAAEVGAHVAGGAVPPAFTNQLDLYAGIGNRNAWATLDETALDRYFKDTDFDVLPGVEASRDTP